MNAPTPPLSFARTPLASVMVMDRMTNPEVMAILDEMIADCTIRDELADFHGSDYSTHLEIAAADAYAATRTWVELFERQAAEPHRDLTIQLTDARDRMRIAHIAHADEQEIEAIGPLGGGRYMRPGGPTQGLYIYDNDGEDALAIVPRGLGRDVVLLILGTYDHGFDHGERQGMAKARAQVTALAASL